MNFQEGIKTLNNLTQMSCYSHYQKIYNVTVTSFKIFAYYSTFNFDEALELFSVLNAKKLSESNRYNYTMIKAIKSTEREEYNNAISLFQ